MIGLDLPMWAPHSTYTSYRHILALNFKSPCNTGPPNTTASAAEIAGVSSAQPIFNRLTNETSCCDSSDKQLSTSASLNFRWGGLQSYKAENLLFL